MAQQRRNPNVGAKTLALSPRAWQWFYRWLHLRRTGMIDQAEFLDFIYVGVPRCGSTWLAAVLNEHPEVFIPTVKEVHFFNDRLIYPFDYKYPRGIDYYRRFFREAPRHARIGELSPFYYYDPNAAFRIARHFPDVKIVVFLRDPVKMLVSLYLLLRGRERRASTFEAELGRRPQLIDLGFYHRLLTPYFDYFPGENIYIAIYEEFFADERRHLPSLLRFLGVDPAFTPRVSGIRINAASAATPSRLGQLRGDMIRLINHPLMRPAKEAAYRLGLKQMDYSGTVKSRATEPDHPPIDPQTVRWLQAQFAPDLARLERLLGLSLDGWRSAVDARRATQRAVRSGRNASLIFSH